ncbi:MAG TPA: hypothetical protein DEG17_24615 [Cyanobacteria bacterium UBA11149]|nr:hypothetical protein [Cyanobacteria bacterium UBA11367]HBE60679.1 hypothetical protein [Cyanobacteria bacterium UBA11366]HBK63889.1 hypothetical protein [Cyanobacteria bacterium UBA11166]HBR72982.1 hypothetical protein [Cyanobacteria bacterium UBA11159]HBS69445.1 hypothetical protein [Cyanobacteria bacterium UBA11153]HBW91962.1 hypothetical protein [Cyanobacteria bacterium UBA11149]HCA96025.1 hypothetical protein [Cyanobacteria bacterium UBA9226]
MNTPSHFLMTAAINKGLPKVPIAKSGFLLGSIAPDMPLWILSLGGIAYYHWFKGWSLNQTFNYLFDKLYFENPFWIGSHNFFHAPILLILALGFLWRYRQNIGSLYHWFFWFFAACFLHSIVDIFTHADDGPLLFFPLEWTIRFNSPVSYWDPRYYGREFAIFELVLDVVLILYLILPRISRFLRKVMGGY